MLVVMNLHSVAKEEDKKKETMELEWQIDEVKSNEKYLLLLDCLLAAKDA